MSYEPSGHLTTDERQVDDEETWDSNADWNAAQDTNNVVVQDGSIQLAEATDSDFEVTIDTTNSPVEEGETLTVDYTINNTGTAQDTQDIILEIDSTQEDVDQDVMIAASGSHSDVLEWLTEEGDAGTLTATVLSDDDSDSTSVTVEEAPALPDSLVVRYLMDEESGTALTDDSGNGNDGTLIGSNWRSDANAVGGWQTTYDGADDYGEVDNSGSIEDAEFTVIITPEFASGSLSDENPLISKGRTRFGSGEGGSWSLERSGQDLGQIKLRVDDGSLVQANTSTTITTADTKIQAVGRVEEGNRVSVGVNGQMENSESIGTLETNNDPIDWMSDQDRDGFYVEGAVGTIEYYASALSDQEIQDRYNALPWS